MRHIRLGEELVIPRTFSDFVKFFIEVCKMTWTAEVLVSYVYTEYGFTAVSRVQPTTRTTTTTTTSTTTTTPVTTTTTPVTTPTTPVTNPAITTATPSIPLPTQPTQQTPPMGSTRSSSSPLTEPSTPLTTGAYHSTSFPIAINQPGLVSVGPADHNTGSPTATAITSKGLHSMVPATQASPVPDIDIVSPSSEEPSVTSDSSLLLAEGIRAGSTEIMSLISIQKDESSSDNVRLGTTETSQQLTPEQFATTKPPTDDNAGQFSL